MFIRASANIYDCIVVIEGPARFGGMPQAKMLWAAYEDGEELYKRVLELYVGRRAVAHMPPSEMVGLGGLQTVDDSEVTLLTEVCLAREY